jgi:light-regulated signal transduction histidine kinase (bacteriophytochrome)
LIENKKYTQIETISLQECLNEVSTSINSLIHDSKAKINVDFSAFDKITFNKAYMKKYFLNLLTAIKYAKPDHIPTITIQSKIVNGINQLIFSDQGSGFDMDKVKDKIFGLYENFMITTIATVLDYIYLQSRN